MKLYLKLEFQSPAVLTVSNLTTSPTSIRTRLLQIMQLGSEEFLFYFNWLLFRSSLFRSKSLILTH